MTPLRRLLRLPFRSLALVLLAACLAGPADAQDAGFGASEFGSLRAGEVNMRKGPGLRYAKDWVYVRRNLPVRVLRRSDVWREIEDWQGTRGWVHQSMLSSRRTVIVTGDTVRALRAEPDRDGALVARVEPGVIARLVSCQPRWCELEADGLRGWMQRGFFWGVDDTEAMN